MSLFGEDEDVDAHTFRVLAPSLVPAAPVASRSIAHPRRAFAASGEDSSAMEEISRLRRDLHLDAGRQSPAMRDIEETFGRYANRASFARPRVQATDREAGGSAEHPRRQLNRAAALGTVEPPVDDVRRIAASAIDEARRQADERVAAAVAAVRREADEQLAKMQADLDSRAREIAQQMAASQLDRARAEAVEQLRAELRGRNSTAGLSGAAVPLRLIRAFRGWRASAQQQAEYKARLRRLMLHFSHFSLSVALRGWKAGIMWYRRANGLLAKAGRRIHSLRLGRAWTTWCDDTRRVRKGRRALARLVNTKVCRAFECWRWMLVAKTEAHAQLQTGHVVLLETKRVDEQRERLVLNAMQRWRRGTLLIQFQCWASRTAVAIKAKQQLNVCMRRIQQRLATMAFQRWLARTIEMQRQRVILTRAVLRFQNRFQAAAVRKWQSYVRMQHIGRRVIATFRHSRVRKAWQHWLYQTLRIKSSAGDDNLTAVITRAVLNQWRHRHLAWCWMNWRDKHRDGMLYKARLRRLLCHFGHFHTATAFRGWLRGIAWQRRSKGLLTKAARRMQTIVIGRAWRSWLDVCRILRRGRRALARMLQSKKTSMASRSFLRWRETVAAQRQLEREMVRLKGARTRLERQQEAAVRLANQARQRDRCRKLLHAWRVVILSVETKLAHALGPLQHALDIAKERIATEAEAKSRESEQLLQEAIDKVVAEGEKEREELREETDRELERLKCEVLGEAEAQAEAQADERVKRLIAKAEAKCEQRHAAEMSRMQRDMARQVAEASRCTRQETERKMTAALVAADRAVLAATGVCELRRTNGPRLRLGHTDFDIAKRTGRNRIDRHAV